MQTKNFTIILLRVAAVLVMSRGFTYVGQLISVAMRGPAAITDLTLVSALTLLLPLAMGIVAWVIAPWVASLAVRALPASMDTGALTATGLAHAAFIVIGVWMALDALPSIINNVIGLLAADHPTRVSWLASNVLRLVLGVALIVGSRATSRALLQLRYAGTHE